MIWYTRQGSEEFNREIHITLKKLAHDIEEAVGDRFEALVLGGGYGREEGACVVRDGRESLYNDLDLFLITTDPYTIPATVRSIQKRYEEILGIDVDIGAPLTKRDLSRLPNQLMWQDLLHGHVVLSGPKDIITAHISRRLYDPLPHVEAIRLMLNRGSGLLQAIMESESSKGSGHSMPDPDFIRRNYYKTTLAFGDSLTIVHDSYTVHLPDRLSHLESVISQVPEPFRTAVPGLYKDAITFKQQPDAMDQEQPSTDLLTETAELWVGLFLYIETKRTGRVFENPHSYIEDTFIREPEQHKGKYLIRNLIRNAASGKISFRYPRERLYRDLVRLLSAPEPHSDSWTEDAGNFLDVWKLYN